MQKPEWEDKDYAVYQSLDEDSFYIERKRPKRTLMTVPDKYLAIALAAGAQIERAMEEDNWEEQLDDALDGQYGGSE
jgi:hypothetical protein